MCGDCTAAGSEHVAEILRDYLEVAELTRRQRD